jgi:hypothetical protein
MELGAAIAPVMGTEARPIIKEVLRKLGVETRPGTGVASLDDTGVTLTSGKRLVAAHLPFPSTGPGGDRRRRLPLGTYLLGLLPVYKLDNAGPALNYHCAPRPSNLAASVWSTCR